MVNGYIGRNKKFATFTFVKPHKRRDKRFFEVLVKIVKFQIRKRRK